MNRLYYIGRLQQWISIPKIVTIYRAGENWEIILEGNNVVVLNDGEYVELTAKLNEPPHKPEHKEGD